MRSYLEITCRVVVEEEDKIELMLLIFFSCKRFSSGHIG